MNCECTRIMSLFGKHSDLANASIPHLELEHDGYMPYLGPFGGDDFSIDVCMDCGKIQDWEPITDEKAKEAFGDDEEDDDDEAPIKAPVIDTDKVYEPKSFSMVDVKEQFYTKILKGEYGDNWQTNPEAIDLLMNDKAHLPQAEQQAIERLLKKVRDAS